MSMIDVASYCASICQLDVVVAESFHAHNSLRQPCRAIDCKIANKHWGINIKLSVTGVSVVVQLLPVLFVVDSQGHVWSHDIKVRSWISAHEQLCGWFSSCGVRCCPLVEQERGQMSLNVSRSTLLLLEGPHSSFLEAW